MPRWVLNIYSFYATFPFPVVLFFNIVFCWGQLLRCLRLKSWRISLQTTEECVQRLFNLIPPNHETSMQACSKIWMPNRSIRWILDVYTSVCWGPQAQGAKRTLLFYYYQLLNFVRSSNHLLRPRTMAYYSWSDAINQFNYQKRYELIGYILLFYSKRSC